MIQVKTTRESNLSPIAPHAIALMAGNPALPSWAPHFLRYHVIYTRHPMATTGLVIISLLVH
jgi:hypothetical protein